MKIFITGASGYLGNKLAHTLAESGHQISAFVRSDEAKKLLQHPNITVFTGDILNKGSLVQPMKDCTQVYHMAAKVGAWAKDSAVFYEINVGGTRNVLQSAVDAGVKKFVFTSTSGVIGPAVSEPLDETSPRSVGYTIDYDLSKKAAEELVFQYSEKNIHTVIVSPTKVFGPGKVSHSLSANAIIKSFMEKKIALIPGPASYRVCFAFIDDVLTGHIQAMEKGRRGEKYILGGTNISYYEFFDAIRSLSGGTGKIIKLPKGIVKSWAYLQQLNHNLFGQPVRFTVKSVDHLFSNYIFSSEKAIHEFGYAITPINEAIMKTIFFLKGK